MRDLQAKYSCVKYQQVIHHLALKMFENIRKISKSIASHSTSQFQSLNKEHRKILKEAQMIKLQSTKWNGINTYFCSWLSERNDHSIFPQNMMDIQSTPWGWEIFIHHSQISAKEKSYQIHTVQVQNFKLIFWKFTCIFSCIFAWNFCLLFMQYGRFTHKKRTHVMLQFLWPVLYEPIDSK